MERDLITLRGSGRVMHGSSYYSEELDDQNFQKSLVHTKSNTETKQDRILDVIAIPEATELNAGAIHKIWCLLELKALAKLKKPPSSIQVDFVVVIDHSSSMRMNNKLAFVQATIQYFIEQLNESHRFCLVEFNSQVHKVTDGLLEMNPENKKRVLESLKDIKPEGSTNISDALFTAIDILKERRGGESSRISSVMLFTGDIAYFNEISVCRWFGKCWT